MYFLIINGPNLNLLGSRKSEIYGFESLDTINTYISGYFKKVKIDFFQNNHEGEIIDKIQSAHEKYKGIVINAGALSHYSYAIRDAIEASAVPVIEVHMTNLAKRENFRQHSVLSSVCWGRIEGFGKYSYILAVTALAHKIKSDLGNL